MAEDSPTIRRVRLGRLLAQYRKRAGKTSGDIDGTNGSSKTMSKSKLYQIERGALKTVRWQDVMALGYLYSVSSAENKHLIEMAESCASSGMWEEFGISDDFATFLDQESVATTIYIYESEFINGLFHTQAYLDALRDVHDDPDTGTKMKRQHDMFRRDPMPTIVFVMSEAVLRRRVGNTKVMKDQVARLLELSAVPQVSVYVLPFRVGAHRLMHGAFQLMEFGEDGVFPATVYLESLDGARYEERERTVKRYKQAFEETLKQAVPIEDFVK